MKMSFVFSLIVSFAALCGANPCLNVVSSGESHGMLFPCDCPVEPGGGMAKRMTVVKGLRLEQKNLLLDAGGFAGGGPYDTYTEGRSGDSVRTVAMIRAMGALAYDAVAVGDDDLVYGARWLARMAAEYHVPLVCANVRDSLGTVLFAPYTIVARAGLRIAVVGVVTSERLFPGDKRSHIVDPEPVLDSLLPILDSLSDIQILLCHGGDAMSTAAATRYPVLDLVVNGHRKGAREPIVPTSGAPVLEFGFQGKSLSFVPYDCRSGQFDLARARWIAVDASVPEDTLVAQMLQRPATAQHPGPYDLYIMSQCPYGLDALRGFTGFVSRFPAVSWSVWFIGSVDAVGEFRSLHGEDEVADERLWLAVQELYPDQWPLFLSLRARVDEPTQSTVRSLNMDTLRLKAWIDKSADSVLAMHYRRSQRLGIDASPTLLVSNVPVEFPPTLPYLARTACGGRNDAPFCDSLPVCLDDTDCRKPGFVGTCAREEAEPVCQFSEAVRFPFVVVGAGDSLSGDEAAAVETTRDLFPGAEIEILTPGSKRWSRLVQELKPEGLPLYLFGKTVQTAAGFDKVERGLVPFGEYLTFRPGIMRLSLFPDRFLTAGTVRLFVDPADNRSRQLVSAAAQAGVLKTWDIVPLVPAPPAGDTPTLEEQVRREEVVRWELLRAKFPTEFKRYIEQWAQDGSVTQWQSRVGNRARRALAQGLSEQSAELYQKAWERCEPFGLRGPALLVDNQRLVLVESSQDLTKFIEKKRR